MLKNITIKQGDGSKLVLSCGGVIVLVGPNNSGKSLLLREIESITTVSTKLANLKIVDDFEIHRPTFDKMVEVLKDHSVDGDSLREEGAVTVSKFGMSGVASSQTKVHVDVIRPRYPTWSKHQIAGIVFHLGLVRLDGRSRFSLTEDKKYTDLLAPPRSTLHKILNDEDLLRKVREILFAAFQKYFVIDLTKSGQMGIRFSDFPPPADELSLNAAARSYLRSATHIQEASDGVQAFTGIICAVRAGDYHTILLDEPEAFLHPPLARRLGSILCKPADDSGNTLIAATHSSDFLMGCLQEAKNVTIMRLSNVKGRLVARVVDSDALKDLTSHPLMKSANALSSLFYDGCVICEDDNDRAFYAEIYSRLQKEYDIPSIVFLNAKTKQSIVQMMRPLREFGIPAAAIVDIDILKDGGKTFSNWLDAANLPMSARAAIKQSRASVEESFTMMSVEMKSVGIDGLDGDDHIVAEDFFAELDKYGIFTVRVGELERWLSDLGISGKKTDWTINAFDRLGVDPTADDYLHPSDGDVWDFVRGICRWISDPDRRGLKAR
jgi:ABC-type cobalamin/Fe3+-siderophores transport system ATPase subunit